MLMTGGWKESVPGPGPKILRLRAQHNIHMTLLAIKDSTFIQILLQLHSFFFHSYYNAFGPTCSNSSGLAVRITYSYCSLDKFLD